MVCDLAMENTSEKIKKTMVKSVVRVTSYDKKPEGSKIASDYSMLNDVKKKKGETDNSKPVSIVPDNQKLSVSSSITTPGRKDSRVGRVSRWAKRLISGSKEDTVADSVDDDDLDLIEAAQAIENLAPLAKSPPPSRKSLRMSVSSVSTTRDMFEPVTTFLKKHSSFDTLPKSVKVVVLDHNMTVGCGFSALRSHGVKSAPIWDCLAEKFVGLISASDFMDILRHFYRNSLSHRIPRKLKEQKIRYWKKLEHWENDLSVVHPDFLIRHVGYPETSLYEAIFVMSRAGIRRLPLVTPDQRDVLGILEYIDLAKYLLKEIGHSPAIFDAKVCDLCPKTSNKVVTVTTDTALIDAMDVMAVAKCSGLPVVDSKGCLVDIFIRKHLLNLTKEDRFMNLEIPMSEFMRLKDNRPDIQNWATVSTTSLEAVLLRCVKLHLHRVVIVNNMLEMKVIGIVTLKDLLSAMLTDRRLNESLMAKYDWLLRRLKKV